MIFIGNRTTIFGKNFLKQPFYTYAYETLHLRLKLLFKVYVTALLLAHLSFNNLSYSLKQDVFWTMFL